MRIAESWLRDWIDPDLDTTALAEQLTMVGLEVDGVHTEGGGLEGVVIGEVTDVAKHPDADRLSVCRVITGQGEPVEVVCGAPNVVAGMKSPLAVPGVKLPNGLKLKKSKIRGVVSNGMLCSAEELELGDDSDGIISLPADAPVGAALADYLGLPDGIIDVDLTPNRGDCFSMLGVARDLAALTGAPLKVQAIDIVPASIDDTQPVETPLPAGCPSFAGRVIRNIDRNARSPLWMTERLRRVGLRPIHPVVDVTNYVMLEFGQPLHGYDYTKIRGTIRPRAARSGEKVVLLDEKEITLHDDTLVITDDSGVIGLAGIMGGLSTAVSDDTVDVFFEAAFWPPAFMAGQARSYGLHTDASLRFERGVDPHEQVRAVERATALLVQIAGGEAGPLTHVLNAAELPQRPAIVLRRERLAHLLGARIDDAVVSGILERLGLRVEAVGSGWQVTPPSYRFDINLEVDLIEEVARIYGYDGIPQTTATAETPLARAGESEVEFDRVAQTLIARDYQEVVNYSFVDRDTDAAFTGETSGFELSNPISSEMSVMRGSMWSGLVTSAAANVARQQERVRLFEIGRSFHGSPGSHREIHRVAGLAVGPAVPEQWGTKARPLDFFDIKADVSALLELAGDACRHTYEPLEHPALQVGQSARVLRDGVEIGVLGKLHPSLAKRFEIKRDVYLFEINADLALVAGVPAAKPVSRYPAIRRDIAVVVDEKVSAAAIVDAVASTAPALIRDVKIFDVYQGPGIEAGLKSIALGLILQETSRTLTDVDADTVTSSAVRKLQQDFAAELRD